MLEVAIIGGIVAVIIAVDLFIELIRDAKEPPKADLHPVLFDPKFKPSILPMVGENSNALAQVDFYKSRKADEKFQCPDCDITNRKYTTFHIDMSKLTE